MSSLTQPSLISSLPSPRHQSLSPEQLRSLVSDTPVYPQASSWGVRTYSSHLLPERTFMGKHWVGPKATLDAASDSVACLAPQTQA